MIKQKLVRKINKELLCNEFEMPCTLCPLEYKCEQIADNQEFLFTVTIEEVNEND